MPMIVRNTRGNHIVVGSRRSNSEEGRLVCHVGGDDFTPAMALHVAAKLIHSAAVCSYENGDHEAEVVLPAGPVSQAQRYALLLSILEPLGRVAGKRADLSGGIPR